MTHEIVQPDQVIAPEEELQLSHADFGNILLDVADSIRACIAQAGSDPVMLESKLRHYATNLETFAFENLGANLRDPVVAAQPRNAEVVATNRGPFGHLPPGTVPAIVTTPTVAVQPVAPPAPGTNPADDQHQAALRQAAALGIRL